MLETILQDRFAVTAVILFGIGFMNLMLQQDLLKKVVGFNIMDSAVFLLLAVAFGAFTAEELRPFLRRKRHDHDRRAGV